MDGFCDGGFAASCNAHHHYVNTHVALLAIDDPVPLRTGNKTTINRKSSISQIKSTMIWKNRVTCYAGDSAKWAVNHAIADTQSSAIGDCRACRRIRETYRETKRACCEVGKGGAIDG